MKQPTLFICVLALSAFLAGCSSEESQKDAIIKALNYDDAIHEQIGSQRGLTELLFGMSDEKKADYVRNLKRVPLDGCPADFKEAYQRHLAAWESRSNSQISSTWNDVLAVARLHGVNHQ